MAAEAYIRTAISQLQRAIGDVQQQIHDAQRSMSDQKGQLLHDIEHLDRERKVHEVGIAQAQANNNSTEIHVMTQRIHQMHEDGESKKAMIARIESDTQALVQRKTQFLNQVQDLSHQLDMLMASPEAR